MPTRPRADSWHLPKRSGADSGMLIGRLDLLDDRTENPHGLVLDLRNVEFGNVAQAVYFGDRGEKNYILSNNYFVAPNLKPGTYRLMSFQAGGAYHGMQKAAGYTYTVGPGQIKFVGSFDYIQYNPSLLQRIGNSLSSTKRFEFSVRKAQHPTELEVLQWLSRAAAGSGWEPTIRKRIHELSGRP